MLKTTQKLDKTGDRISQGRAQLAETEVGLFSYCIAWHIFTKCFHEALQYMFQSRAVTQRRHQKGLLHIKHAGGLGKSCCYVCLACASLMAGDNQPYSSARLACKVMNETWPFDCGLSLLGVSALLASV